MMKLFEASSLVLALLFFVFSCIRVKNAQSLDSAQMGSNQIGLDVNNVSFSFRSLQNLGRSEQDLENIKNVYRKFDYRVDILGDNLLPPSAFDQIVAYAERNGANFKLQSDKPNARPNINAWNYNSWYLMALRFDFCSPPYPDTVDKCLTEVKFTYRPVEIEKDNKYTDHVQDFAIHLVFRIHKNYTKGLADQLLTLREKFEKECPTLGRPLDIHPCLDVLKVPQLAQRFSQELFALVSKLPLLRNKIETIATNRNGDPWIFFQGNWNGREFSAAQLKNLDLEAWRKTIEGLKVKKANDDGATPKALETDMAQGRLQMLNLLGRLTVRPERLVPPLQEIQGIPRFGDAMWEDYRKKLYEKGVPAMEEFIDALQFYWDPRKSQSGNSDCVSCHYATSLYTFHLDRWPKSVLGVETRLERREKFWALMFEKLNWPIEGGVSSWFTNVNEVSNNQYGFRANHVQAVNNDHTMYTVLNFSPYFEFPRVSARVVMESSLSALRANSLFLNLEGPLDPLCDKKAAQLCLIKLPAYVSFEEPETQFSQCLKQCLKKFKSPPN